MMVTNGMGGVIRLTYFIPQIPTACNNCV